MTRRPFRRFLRGTRSTDPPALLVMRRNGRTVVHWVAIVAGWGGFLAALLRCMFAHAQ